MYVYDEVVHPERVGRNVSAASVDLSGLSTEDAVAAIAAYGKQHVETPATLVVDGTEVVLDPADAGLVVVRGNDPSEAGVGFVGHDAQQHQSVRPATDLSQCTAERPLQHRLVGEEMIRRQQHDIRGGITGQDSKHGQQDSDRGAPVGRLDDDVSVTDGAQFGAPPGFVLLGHDRRDP